MGIILFRGRCFYASGRSYRLLENEGAKGLLVKHSNEVLGFVNQSILLRAMLAKEEVVGVSNFIDTIQSRSDLIQEAFMQHIYLSFVALAVGIAMHYL